MTSISRRQFVQSSSALSLAAATVGLSHRAAAQEKTIALRLSSSHVADLNSSHFAWSQLMQANLKKAVGEQIRIDYFPNNQLGKESDVVQQVKVGSIDMMLTGSSIWATVTPQLGMLDLGYVFDSYAHVARAVDAGVGAKLNDMLVKSTGCQIITWGAHYGARNVYTKQPVKSLAEIKNVKLRVLPTPAFIETFKIMGAIPTPISFGELYMAAQTGVVDGFEHDAGTVLANKLNEVVKYCWTTEHLFSDGVRGRQARDGQDSRHAAPGLPQGRCRLDAAAAPDRRRTQPAGHRRPQEARHRVHAHGKERARLRAQGNGNQALGELCQAIPRDGPPVCHHQRRAGLSTAMSSLSIAPGADAMALPHAPGFSVSHASGRWLAWLMRVTEYVAGAVLAIDVVVVFVSVIFRYFLHDPFDWAEEVARALMVIQVFFGAATVLARSQHVGVDLFRGMLPARWQPALIQFGNWIIVGVSASLFASSCELLADSYNMTTSIGLPQWIYVYPVAIGSLFMTLFGLANAVNGPRRMVWSTLGVGLALSAAVVGWNMLMSEQAIPPWALLTVGFFGGMALGMPIAFVLALSSLVFFMADPSLPMLVYSQQVMAGTDTTCCWRFRSSCWRGC